MSLNRSEKIAAMSLLFKQDYSNLGRLLEETANLTQPQKIDALSSLVQIAAEGSRVQYTENAKAGIDGLVDIIGLEERTDSRVTSIDSAREAASSE